MPVCITDELYQRRGPCMCKSCGQHYGIIEYTNGGRSNKHKQKWSFTTRLYIVWVVLLLILYTKTDQYNLFNQKKRHLFVFSASGLNQKMGSKDNKKRGGGLGRLLHFLTSSVSDTWSHMVLVDCVITVVHS